MISIQNSTLAFNGHSFDLTLEQVNFKQYLLPASLPKVNLPSNTSVSGNSKVMPPRPKVAPKLPDWLANRMASRSSSPLSSSASRSSAFRFTPPSRSTSTFSSPFGFSQPSTENLFPSSNSPNPSSSVSSGFPSRDLPSVPQLVICVTLHHLLLTELNR